MVSLASFRSQNKLADSSWCSQTTEAQQPWVGRTRMPLTFTEPQFLKAWLESPRSHAFSLTLEATNSRSREHFEMKQKVTW